MTDLLPNSLVGIVTGLSSLTHFIAFQKGVIDSRDVIYFASLIGFTLFYLGINLGAFAGPLITGLLQTRLGFHYGFGAAAIGMALGLTQYVIFRRNLGSHGRTVPHPLSRPAFWRAAAVRRARAALWEWEQAREAASAASTAAPGARPAPVRH